MRRVLILLTVIAVIVAGLGWAYAISLKRNRLRIEALRKDALASFQAGDYIKSVGKLGEYLDKNKAMDTDAEALFAYGKSRINVEMPRHQEVYEGIQVFTHYLQLKPDELEAQRLLLNLYVLADYNQEALKLSDSLLASHPNDPQALKGKMSALNNQRAYEPALVVSKQLNDVAPTNLEGQLATLWLMQAAKKGNDQIIARGEALRGQHPQDPRFDMVCAYAYHLAGREQDARNSLQEASKRTSTDPEFIAALLKMLDQNGMYEDSGSLIRRSANATSDPKLAVALAQRLWQDGDLQGLLARTAALDSQSPKTDSRLLGYRALALCETGRTTDGMAIAQSLSSRQADGPAAAWAAALREHYKTPRAPAADRVKQLQAAGARDPSNAVVRMMLGNARAETGETELALASWNDASAIAPSWALPLLMSAKATMGSGRYADAVRFAQEAVRRAPGQYDTTTTLAQVWLVYLSKNGDKANYKDLLDLLEKIQATWHDSQTLPAYVSVLLHVGKRDAATQQLKAAQSTSPPIPGGVLLQLAAISDAENLELGSALREQAEKTAGLTPQIAFAQARAMAEGGKSNEGISLLQATIKTHPSEAPWRLQLARYRDSIGDAAALNEWIGLGDQYPANLEVQTSILQTSTVTQDRLFWQRSIDRTHSLTGDQGLLWRTERARWLLEGELSEKDKGEAVNLLTDITRLAPMSPEPHRLLALALLKVNKNNTSRAISELSAAAEGKPADPLITSELVPLLIANNRGEEAAMRLNRLAETPNLPRAVAHWIARELLALDKVDRAIAILEAERQSGNADDERDGLLAGIYRRARRPEQAASLYRGLLDQPVVDPATYAQAADFFASRQDMPSAEEFLNKLAKMPLKPGAAEVIRAQFAERWKSEDDALPLYTAATEAKSEGAWGSLAGFFLRHQKYAQAAGAAAEGLKALPNSEPLKALQRHAAALASAANASSLQPLADLLSREPMNVEVGEMLVALVNKQTPAKEETAVRAKEIADKYPASMPLQLFASQLQLASNHPDRAQQLAQRAANDAPSTFEPQALLARIFVETGDWSRALQSVSRWRQLSSEQPISADLMAARIYLQQPRRDAAAAIQCLAPYLNAPLAQSQQDIVLALYARALIGSGRGDEAANRLRPHLAASKSWRLTWLELAGSGHKDVTTATNWIGQVLPSINIDAPDESVALANAWYTVGAQFDSNQAYESARNILKPLMSAPNPSINVIMLWALTAQAVGDLNEAESAYRRVLKLSPASPDTQNDLAYVLWLRGRKEDLPEAARLSQAAVLSAPSVASFYDTLARIQGSSGDRDSAIRSFRTALQKDSTSLEAMIGLADVLSKDAASHDEVRNLLVKINRRLKLSAPLPPSLRKQLEVVQILLPDAR